MANIIGGIHGHTLEVRVLCGVRLKDTRRFSRQNPFVKLVYGSTERRTVASEGGGVNPSFQDKFEFSLIEGLRRIKVKVYDEPSLGKHVLIGDGKFDLEDVLQKGSMEYSCLIYKNNEAAGEIRLQLTYPKARRPDPYQGLPRVLPPNYGAFVGPSNLYGRNY